MWTLLSILFYLVELMHYYDAIFKTYFSEMPIIVFGNRLKIYENKVDTSLIVQNSYLRTNYVDTNIEEDIDMKKQFRIRNLIDPISITEAVSILHVDNKFKDPSIL